MSGHYSSGSRLCPSGENRFFVDFFCIFKHFCLTLILLYSASTDTCEPHFGVFGNEYNQPNTGVNNFKKPRRYRGSLVQ